MTELADAKGCANPHSRAKSDLTAVVELVDTPNRAGGAANAPAHGTGTEVRMPEDRTAAVARNVYYFDAYVRVEAISEEAAWERVQGEHPYVCPADMATGPDEEVQLVVTDLLDSEPLPKAPECICPPELLARGGFKGRCPVHG
jgi:hypothetical protein